MGQRHAGKRREKMEEDGNSDVVQRREVRTRVLLRYSSYSASLLFQLK